MTPVPETDQHSEKGDSVIEPVLIVEDSPTLALTYREYLRRAGLDAEIADTGAKALDAIDRLSPQVILLDLKLPDMDGLDILRRLNTENSSARVIVITAHGSVKIAVEAMQEGAQDYVQKPWENDRLLAIIDNHVKLRRAEEKTQRLTGHLVFV